MTSDTKSVWHAMATKGITLGNETGFGKRKRFCRKDLKTCWKRPAHSLANGLEEIITSLQAFEAASGFRLPGRRQILADSNEGPPSWPWAGAHSIGDRLRELGLVEVKKERFVGDLIAVYNQPTRSCGRNKASFFLQMQSDRKRGNRYNTQQEKLQTAIMGKNDSEGGETPE